MFSHCRLFVVTQLSHLSQIILHRDKSRTTMSDSLLPDHGSFLSSHALASAQPLWNTRCSLTSKAISITSHQYYLSLRLHSPPQHTPECELSPLEVAEDPRMGVFGTMVSRLVTRRFDVNKRITIPLYFRLSFKPSLFCR